MIDIDLRLPVPADRPFILRSMSEAIRRSPPYRTFDGKAWSSVVEELERRVDGHDQIALVATEPTDPWLIIGFVFGAPLRLTYLHVRGAYRNMGIGRLLAEQVGIYPGGPSCVVDFPTFDVIRSTPGDTLPIGLQHNRRYQIDVQPWMPQEERT